MRLAGKVALISGGARGMGAAEARLLAREGAKVVIGDLLEEEGKQVEAEISEASYRDDGASLRNATCPGEPCGDWG
jgi:NAD(P)-dependent dehydrogenase (short-subunit alcohol dehydrogenase family)